MRPIGMLLLAALLCSAADLETVRSEPDPEKRSDRALDLAAATLSDARQAYSAGDYKKAIGSLKLIEECVDLSAESLKASGKKPHGSKYYKRAELKLRHIGRSFDEFARDAAVDDRAAIESASRKVSQVHDAILSSIMEKR